MSYQVAFFGNMNNFSFKIARELRNNYNVNALLFLNRNDLLHRPESIYPEFKKKYPKWIYDYSHFSEDDFVSPSDRIGEILNYLESSDVVVLNDLGPSLLDYLNKPGISLLTGSDLTYYASFKTLQGRRVGWEKGFRYSAWRRFDERRWMEFILRQRLGILKSKYITMGLRGFVPEMDEIVDEMGIPDDKKIFIFCTDTEYFPYFKKKKLSKKLKIFMTARLTWKLPLRPGFVELDWKRNDIFFKGLLLLKKEELKEIEVLVPEKGTDVSETQDLIKNLNLKKNIRWVKEMSIVDYRKSLLDSDIIVDNLGPGLIGVAGLDAMSIGRVVITNSRNVSNLREPSGFDPPLEPATSEEDIASILKKYLYNRSLIFEKGELASRYIQEHFSLKRVAGLFHEKLISII